MTTRSEADQLRQAREILHLREDADLAETLAALARMRADTATAIAASRPSIQQALRENLEVQKDTQEERDFGWAYEQWRDGYYGV